MFFYVPNIYCHTAPSQERVVASVVTSSSDSTTTSSCNMCFRASLSRSWLSNVSMEQMDCPATVVGSSIFFASSARRFLAWRSRLAIFFLRLLLPIRFTDIQDFYTPRNETSSSHDGRKSTENRPRIDRESTKNLCVFHTADFSAAAALLRVTTRPPPRSSTLRTDA